jgi:hypothetical protein
MKVFLERGAQIFQKFRIRLKILGAVRITRSKLDTKIKVKVPRKRPEGPEGGRGITLLFFYLGARRGGWSAPRPGRFIPGKDPVPTAQEAGWAPGPVWKSAKNLAPTGIRSPDCPARSQSLFRLSYPGPKLDTNDPQNSVARYLYTPAIGDSLEQTPRINQLLKASIGRSWRLERCHCIEFP